MNSKLPIDEIELEMLKLDNQLCFQLYSASKAMTKVYQPHLKDLGLTYPQYLVMLVLWEAEANSVSPISIKMIGEKLFLDTGTLTPLLKRLETADVIERKRSTEDERTVFIFLTEKGKEMSKRASCIPLQLLENVGTPVEDLIALRDTLKDMLQSLREAG
jgi:DNA-binding MarR family transcriptional regulator